MNELEKLMNEIAEWSSQQFPQQEGKGYIGKLNHLISEVEELAETGANEEFADCFMLLIDAWRAKGYSAQELIDITRLKLSINKLRKWGEKNEKGYTEHIK